MAAARGAFSFAAINVADITNFGVALAAQLNVFSTYFETRMSELGDPDLSQDMGDQAREQAHAIEQAIEIKMEVTLTEIANRITRVEMRNAHCCERHGILDCSGKGYIYETKRGTGANGIGSQKCYPANTGQVPRC